MTKIVHHKFIWTLKLSCGICLYYKGVNFMSILRELLYGNIRPNEDKIITDEEERLIALQNILH